MFITIAIIAVLITALLFPFHGGHRSIDAVAPRFRSWEKFLYALMLLGLLILSLTGLITGILGLSPMRHWILILHVTGAPLFAIGIAAIAIAFAERRQFTPNPCPTDIGWWHRLLFWMMLLLALISMLSAVGPMTPTFGAHGQELLYETHRYSSLFLFLVTLLHVRRLWALR